MRMQGRRTFLARQFWRDYVVAWVLIGMGFILSGPGAPVPRWVGVLMIVCGGVIFCCAVGWSIRAAWRAERAR